MLTQQEKYSKLSQTNMSIWGSISCQLLTEFPSLKVSNSEPNILRVLNKLPLGTLGTFNEIMSSYNLRWYTSWDPYKEQLPTSKPTIELCEKTFLHKVCRFWL